MLPVKGKSARARADMGLDGCIPNLKARLHYGLHHLRLLARGVHAVPLQ